MRPSRAAGRSVRDNWLLETYFGHFSSLRRAVSDVRRLMVRSLTDESREDLKAIGPIEARRKRDQVSEMRPHVVENEQEHIRGTCT